MNTVGMGQPTATPNMLWEETEVAELSHRGALRACNLLHLAYPFQVTET